MVNITVAVGFGAHSLATNITLLRAVEVEDIFDGNDDKYRAAAISAEPATVSRYEC